MENADGMSFLAELVREAIAGRGRAVGLEIRAFKYK